MENFENILNSAIDRCDGKIIYDKAFNKGFERIYPFATENISGYIDTFNLKNKKLFTMGSSGDQVLNAIYRDCNDVTVLDINPYTKFYYYLKAAAIIVLSKNEFYDFFRYKDYLKVFKDNNNVFNKEYYEKLKITLRLLDYESYIFWDELFNTYSGKQIRNKLFSMDEDRTYVIEETNLYLNNQKYEEIKNKLKRVNPNFIIGDIFKEELPESYDIIWLSNIGTYLSRHFLKIMIDKMDKILKNDGTLLISYLYQTISTTKYQEDWKLIYDLEKTLMVLKKYNPEFVSFKGVKGIKFDIDDIKDSILVYKKRY